MARRAIRDTFGYERLPTTGEPIEVRRRVMAGTLIPPHMDVPAADVEDSDVEPSPVLGEAPVAPTSTSRPRRGKKSG